MARNERVLRGAAAGVRIAEVRIAKVRIGMISAFTDFQPR